MKPILHHPTFLIVALFFLSITSINSQDLLLEDLNAPTEVFRSSQLINVQTTTMPSKGEYQFHIRHRFGSVGLDKTIITNFLGTDLLANIHFGFIFSLGKNMYVGCGRTKSGKTYNVEIKRLLLRQTDDNSIPVSVAAYVDYAIMSDAFTAVPKYAFYGDAITPFENKFNHRLSYNSQLIISRNLSEKVALQIAPVFVYRNLIGVGMDNYTFALPVSGVIRTGISSSVIFEYAYRFNNKPVNGIYPASIAFEIGTVSHVFQIVLSSNNQLNEQEIYTSESYNYLKGEYLLGFNLKRTFWYKKNKPTLK